MRVELHDVLGEDGRTYTDWIWMDVTDQINVVPYILAPASTADGQQQQQQPVVNRYVGGTFRVFRQNKYGMVGSSLAVLGGGVEMAAGEAPLAAAKRELEEELAMVTRVEENWIDLGTYRVNVNRGHGFISCFLVVDPVEKARRAEDFHVDELERQAVVDLTLDQMEAAVRQHAFAEVKWQAAATMALMEVKRIIQEEQDRIDQLATGGATMTPPAVVDPSTQQRRPIGGRRQRAAPSSQPTQNAASRRDPDEEAGGADEAPPGAAAASDADADADTIAAAADAPQRV